MSDAQRPRGSGLAFRLGRYPVSLPWNAALGIALIAFLWSDALSRVAVSTQETVVLAVVFALLLYVSILFHELAHAWAATAVGNPVHGITLFVMGGLTSYERRRPSAWREAVIAASGPATSVLVGLGCLALSRSPVVTDYRAYALLVLLGRANIILGIFNALPGLPLDGGAVLKSVLWGITRDERRSTRIAAWSGRVVAVLVLAVLVVLPLMKGAAPDVANLAIAVILSGFMYTQASAVPRRENVVERVDSVSVAALARRAVLVPAELPLSEGLRRQVEEGASALVVVDADGRPLAAAVDEAVAAVPLARRPWVSVASVSARIDPPAVLPAGLRGGDVIEALQAHPAPQYLVVGEQGELVGVLVTRDVERLLAGAL